MQIKKLNIIQLNVNSIRSITKRHELNILLKQERPDILLLNETKLNNKHRVSFENYNFVRNDRPNNNGGGGTGILVADSISFLSLPVTNLNSIECSAIKIPLSNGKNLIVVAVYIAKCMQNTIDINDLNLILNLKNNDTEIIIGGDFNAHHPFWQSNITSPNGRAIYNWYMDVFSIHAISLNSTLFPTRHCYESNAYLDLFFVSNSININYQPGYSNFLKTIPFESDHHAVVLPISLEANTILMEPIMIKNYAITNWKKFNKKIDDSIQNLQIPEDRNISNLEIDIHLTELTDLLQNTIETEVPQAILKHKGQIPLPKHILSVIKYKNQLRKILHRNNYRRTDISINSQIKCLNIMIKKLIFNHYNHYYETKLSNVRPDNNLYKNLKKFSGFKLKDKFTEVLISANNDQFFSSLEKANGIGQHFENVHKRTLDQGDAIFSESINTIIENEFSPASDDTLTYFGDIKSANQDKTQFHPFEAKLHDQPLQIVQPLQIPGQIVLKYNNWNYMSFTTPSEILSIISAKNSKKSFGSDGISNFVLRKLSPKFYEHLALIFNHILNNAYWPKCWKNGIVIPILKPSKNPTSVDSYRPITLLSCLSKVFESWILQKIRKHCDDNLIIPDEQFGFRPRHSTIHALSKFTHDVTSAINMKIPTVACSLDCEKAFDTTWIEGLLYKLKYLYGLNDHLCRLLYNYLKNRTFQVKIENSYSENFQILAGVPQGSVLAPVLYTLFIADIPLPLNTNIKKIVFADDILVYLPTQSLLGNTFNNYLDTIYDHLNRWKIKINTNKCEAIVFKGSYKTLPRWVSKKINRVQIKMRNHVIDIKTKIKYLGIIFTKNLKFFDHIKHIISKTMAAFQLIKHIFFQKYRYTNRVKIILYKQLIRPIILYGFAIWHDISSAQMEKLRVLERKMLRCCIVDARKKNSYMFINNNELYEKSNTIRLDRVMIDHARKLFENFNVCNNELINIMLNEHNNDYYLDETNIFKSVLHLRTLLNSQNLLYDNNDNLIYYHKRAHDHDQNNLVYSTDQNVN
jgi:hypothetical protein